MALDELREQLEAGEARADELRESWRAELESSEHRGVAAQEATTSLLEELLNTRPSFAYSLPVHSLHTLRDRVASLTT